MAGAKRVVQGPRAGETVGEADTSTVGEADRRGS
jgi:hypothetical protein